MELTYTERVAKKAAITAAYIGMVNMAASKGDVQGILIAVSLAEQASLGAFHGLKGYKGEGCDAAEVSLAATAAIEALIAKGGAQ